MTKNWDPFLIDREVQCAPRALNTVEGIADRIRAAAFAEMQAEAAFDWAADHYTDAVPALRDAWRRLAREEAKHLHWLLTRLGEMKQDIRERPVNDSLWFSLTKCASAQEFCHYMADAEERGRRAGERFQTSLRASDPVTADIFARIAREEAGHIAIAYRFYPLAR